MSAPFVGPGPFASSAVEKRHAGEARISTSLDTNGGGDTCFAASARRLAGLSAAALGWSPDAFWRATPEELATVLAAMTGEEAGGVPVDAAMLAIMREAYPDG